MRGRERKREREGDSERERKRLIRCIYYTINFIYAIFSTKTWRFLETKVFIYRENENESLPVSLRVHEIQ